MTGSRHEQQASTHTATGIAPDSHRIPSSPPLRMGRHGVMTLFGAEIIPHPRGGVNPLLCPHRARDSLAAVSPLCFAGFSGLPRTGLEGVHSGPPRGVCAVQGKKKPAVISR